MSRNYQKTVVVCGSGSSRPDSTNYRIAEAVGKRLGAAGYAVATGGYGGTMEAALKGAHSGKVTTIGVTLSSRVEAPNEYVATRIEADSYTDRLMELVGLGDAFVILEGGPGTLLELAMVWALKSRGVITACPIVCLCEQWREVVETMSFYSEQALAATSFLHFASDVDEAVALIARHVPLDA